MELAKIALNMRGVRINRQSVGLIHANLVKLYRLTEDAKLVLTIKASLKMVKDAMTNAHLKQPKTETLNFIIQKHKFVKTALILLLHPKLTDTVIARLQHLK
jgi:hypothetical protein